MAWSQKGPFRVRVIEEPGSEGSFREAAAPQRGLEVLWDKQPLRSSTLTPGLVVGIAIVVVSGAGLGGALHFHDELPTSVMRFIVFWFIVMASSVTAYITKRQRRPRRLAVEQVLRVGSAGVMFRDGNHSYPLPRARVAVEVAHDHGRTQAVLVSDDERFVLHDTHNATEAIWLVERVREALDEVGRIEASATQ